MDTQKIDLEIEKLIFLSNAEEGNPGIYELTWELGCYPITIEDKYKITHQLLTTILKDELVILEKFSDLTLTKKIGSVQLNQIEEILNNPASWYPCNEVYSIALTEKGKAYLDEQAKKYSEKLTLRLFYKTS
jgi:hypothetical protein